MPKVARGKARNTVLVHLEGRMSIRILAVRVLPVGILSIVILAVILSPRLRPALVGLRLRLLTRIAVFLVVGIGTVAGDSVALRGGLTLVELARLMRRLGAEAALNFDGGGSTTLAGLGRDQEDLRVLNSPSDGSQRSIPDGIAVLVDR